MVNMSNENIPWENEAKVIKKAYKIRRTGHSGGSIETTIPKEVFEREARRLDMDLDEALNDLQAVWRFDNFPGLHLSFEKQDDRTETS
jgi:hypothetical protein